MAINRIVKKNEITELTDIVIERIKRDGPISFHDHMEMTLGNSARVSEGLAEAASGNNYTHCNLTSLFGGMVGRQLEEMWLMMGERPFTIAVYGAGSLSLDILEYLKNNTKLYARLNFCIIGTTNVPEEVLNAHDVVSIYHTIGEIPLEVNCVLSDGMLEHLPMHQVVMADELMEVYLDYKGNRVTEVLKPAHTSLRQYLKEQNIVLEPGSRTEINLNAASWIGEVAKKVKEGYVMTIDYDYPSLELYSEHRNRGAVVSYNKHRVNDLLYTEAPRQENTAHVNLAAIHHWGTKNGLDIAGYTNKAHLLLSLGLKEQLVAHLQQYHEDIYLAYKKNNIVLHKLLKEIGNKFKVLIQHKGLPELQLTGLKMAMPHAATALALPARVNTGFQIA